VAVVVQQTEHLLLVLREAENEGTVLQMLAVLLESQFLHQCQGRYLWLEMCSLSVVLAMEQAGLQVETGLVADLLLGQELSLAAASLHLPHLLTHNLHLISVSPISMYILPTFIHNDNVSTSISNYYEWEEIF
jgi:hypothetical protein